MVQPSLIKGGAVVLMPQPIERGTDTDKPDAWPRIAAHHGHSPPRLGCSKCRMLGQKGGWTCVCGTPNQRRVKCAHCGQSEDSTRKQCLCKHTRKKHHQMSGACSARRCNCLCFSTTGNKGRGDGEARGPG